MREIFSAFAVSMATVLFVAPFSHSQTLFGPDCSSYYDDYGTYHKYCKSPASMFDNAEVTYSRRFTNGTTTRMECEIIEDSMFTTGETICDYWTNGVYRKRMSF